MIARAFKDLINLDKDCEKIKAELAVQEDFNLIEAFGIVDHNGKGYVTPLELRDVLIEIGALNRLCPIESVHLFFDHFNKTGDGKLRYSEFSDAFMPYDEHYSRLLGVKRIQFLKNSVYFSKYTMNVYMRVWELLIMNEKAVEVIRQRISKRYRYDIERAFLTCDLNRDGVISINDVTFVL